MQIYLLRFVLPEGEKVKFISDGFDKFFLKLVRALKNTAKSINKEEKEEILKSIKSTEKEVNDHAKLIYRGNLKLIGYSSKESREKYQKIVSKAANNEIDLDDYRPILLPRSTKHLVTYNIGDKIPIEDEIFLDSYGHFAGYRNDDLAISVDKRTRDELQLITNSIYQVEIDPEKKVLKFVARL
ncbi:MAG: hypothetical protein IPJ32_11240 [Sphingobacteriaceae bacterium]|nr:hypothetical protein [Sphingobacteriaceae bacterium]